MVMGEGERLLWMIDRSRFSANGEAENFRNSRTSHFEIS
jgi:hypothetical protein